MQSVSRINLRPVLRVLGLMSLIESAFLLISLFVAIGYNGDDVIPFFRTLLIMLTIGIVFFFIGSRQQRQQAERREGILIVTLTWVLFSVVGMLPFLFGGYVKTVSDAFFETISGFTTTGATIFSTVEQLPHGILFWRSIIQWQGGIGIVVFSMAMLPVIMGGNSAALLYNAETTGIIHERILPRITDVAKRTAVVYLVITTTLVLLLWMGPMNLFESVCHAFTCVSTGGYSTRDGSIAEFNSPYIEYILTIFMFIGSLSIGSLYFCFIGKPGKLFKDEEFHWFVGFSLLFVIVTTFWLMSFQEYPTIESNFRHAVFQVYSLVSSTGYLTSDIMQWKPFFWCIALLLMFFCGCSGSTAGGLKISRLLVLMKNLRNEFLKRTNPNMYVPVRANGAVIPGRFVSQVLAFFFVYLGLIFIGFILLCLDGVEFSAALGASVSSTGNVGPAFGDLAVTYASLTPFSKWILSFLMLAGRLEVFTVLLIFSPHFWRK